MSQYFECVRCGAVTVIENAPPKCRSCGHGTGVLHAREPGSKERSMQEKRARDAHSATGDPADSANPATAS